MRRIVLRLLDDSDAVTECGYMNSASAEPSARVAYAQPWPTPGMNAPVGLPVASLVVAILSCAAPKIASQPPTWPGR